MTMANENLACEWHPQTNKIEEVESISIDRHFNDTDLKVESDRYHLVWGAFCPWATPVKIELSLLGLDNQISSSNVDSLRRQGRGADWFYHADGAVDQILKTTKLSESYEKTQPGYTGKAGVPTLIDLNNGEVVSNNFDTLTNEFAENWQTQVTNGIDLSPKDIREEVHVLDQVIVEKIAQAPGKILQVSSQDEYNQLANDFFDTLAELNQRLETRKYLFGDRLTQSDVRLFVSLVRFDIVYYYQNKLSAKRLIDFVNLWEYAKRLYQIPAFKQNTDFDAIFDHFYRIDESEVEAFERVVPFGIDLAKWEEA